MGFMQSLPLWKKLVMWLICVCPTLTPPPPPPRLLVAAAGANLCSSAACLLSGLHRCTRHAGRSARRRVCSGTERLTAGRVSAAERHEQLLHY